MALNHADRPTDETDLSRVASSVAIEEEEIERRKAGRNTKGGFRLKTRRVLGTLCPVTGSLSPRHPRPTSISHLVGDLPLGPANYLFFLLAVCCTHCTCIPHCQPDAPSVSLLLGAYCTRRPQDQHCCAGLLNKVL